jgi:hypothetical protein
MATPKLADELRQSVDQVPCLPVFDFDASSRHAKTDPQDSHNRDSWSDPEGQQELEVGYSNIDKYDQLIRCVQVTFNDESTRRRKSSLVPSQPPSFRHKTRCFVHSLLQKHEGIPVKDHTITEEAITEEQCIDKVAHDSQHALHESRLLTKNQISDMAFGIRELAKKLGQLRIKLNVHNVFILTKAHDDSLIADTREVAEWLLTKNSNYKVFVVKPVFRTSADIVPGLSRTP